MSSKPSISIVFQTDDGHAWMTGIALRSLIASFEQSPSSQTYGLSIVFVSHGLNAENTGLLLRNCRSQSVDVHHEIVDCPLQASDPAERRIELFTLRLRFPEVLPHLDRVLFLDSDILVVDDISKLWEIDLHDQWLGAAACLNTSDDVCLRNYNNEFKIKFNQAIDPINGGVVMLDLRKMRELRVTQAMLDWMQAHRDTIYNPDQEAISMHCGGQFTVLPPEWNYRLFAEPYWTSSWQGYREYIRLKPSLIHFQNPLRPNLLKANLPYFADWVQCHNEVMRSELTSAKRMGYFLFVYFEFYFIITQLARVIASYRWRIFLTSVTLLPYSLVKYLQYALSPGTYRFRIWKQLASAASATRTKNDRLASAASH